VQTLFAQPVSLWLRISGLDPAAATLQGARLEANAELAALLGGQRALLARRLAESRSLLAFLVELQHMVDRLSLERWATWLQQQRTVASPAWFQRSYQTEKGGACSPSAGLRCCRAPAPRLSSAACTLSWLRWAGNTSAAWQTILHSSRWRPPMQQGDATSST
jgi:hypothetical protein